MRLGLSKVSGRVADITGLKLDYAVSFIFLWITVGVSADIRKHIEGFSFAEEGFVTPEHTMFYSGFIALFVLMTAIIFARRTKYNLTWVQAIPRGYRYGLLGLVLFFLGGFGDLAWHSAFGAESNVEALLSPTHLTLAFGGGLFISSPLRSAWGLDLNDSWRSQFPAVLSAGLVCHPVVSFTLYAHPVTMFAFREGMLPVSLGVGSILLQLAFLTALAIALVRRFNLRPGAFTMIFTVNGFGIIVLGLIAYDGATWFFIPYIVSGMTADFLAWFVINNRDRTLPFRVFCTLVPAVWTSLYLLTAHMLTGIGWVVHVWTGSIFLSGVTGLLLSFLVVPTKNVPSIAQGVYVNDSESGFETDRGEGRND